MEKTNKKQGLEVWARKNFIKKIIGRVDNESETKSLVWSPTHNETQWNKVHLPLLLSMQQARRKWLLITITELLYKKSNVQ